MERSADLKTFSKEHHRMYFMLFILTACFAMLLCAPYFTGAQEDQERVETEEEGTAVEDSIEFAPSSGVRDLINFDIFDYIAQAKALLEERKCGFQVVKVKRVQKAAKGEKGTKGKKGQKGKKGKKGQKGKKARATERAELGEFSILLAVLNAKTRAIEVVRVHPRLGGRSENVVVEAGKSNGVNTKFRIVYPEHHVVLALKRPVRSGKGFKEVVYTPYSEDLDIPVIRKAGLDYLKGVLDTAARDLVRRGVKSRSGERFVVDDVALTLALIEHIDPLKFESGRYTVEKLVHETLVIMGTNTRAAYRYSTSGAGARGLFQFIPGTYKLMVRLYPGAGLHGDFVLGMEDHVNAAKASFLLFDADLRTLGNGVRGDLGDPRVKGRALASAYNCGSGRTRAAMDRYGENWPQRVPAETQIYLRKFDAVYDWLHGGAVRPQSLR